MVVQFNVACVFILVFVYTGTGCTDQGQKRARTDREPGGAAELTVFAAASLTDAVTEISKSFESEREVRVYTNFASSQTLQVQIERGAPADLFISASPKQMDVLQEKGAIQESSRRDVLRNSLVLVAPTGSSYKIERPEELAGSHTRRIAIGEPSFPSQRASTERKS